MSLRSKRFLPALLLLGACGPQESKGVDPMSEDAGGTIRRTLTCEAKDAAGNCLKKTCKADDRGDCRTYAGYCLDADHHWSGTSAGGSCSVIL